MIKLNRNCQPVDFKNLKLMFKVIFQFQCSWAFQLILIIQSQTKRPLNAIRNKTSPHLVQIWKVALKLFWKLRHDQVKLILDRVDFQIEMMIGQCSMDKLGQVWCWRFLCLRSGWGHSKLDWKVSLMVWLWSECDQYKFSGQGGNVISSNMMYKWQIILMSRPNGIRFNGLLWEMGVLKHFGEIQWWFWGWGVLGELWGLEEVSNDMLREGRWLRNVGKFWFWK